ncbi:hypothetical protein B0J11DRAFT_584280 [Dendryphion nanum]|uniref:Uncharacterized protein n=1 Tax=Dendryphion nanum TaxID=256645 RepID=A0A9P9DC53_9PLEO|nr:hypothetical protein B0J11DRAFT_584280 [Dendryphion nanum]
MAISAIMAANPNDYPVEPNVAESLHYRLEKRCAKCKGAYKGFLIRMCYAMAFFKIIFAHGKKTDPLYAVAKYELGEAKNYLDSTSFWDTNWGWREISI